MKTSNPIIGISGQNSRTKSVRSMMVQVRDEGAVPVFLTNDIHPSPAYIKRDIAWIDALVVMGNSLDIDPKTYINRYPENDPKCSVHPQTSSELSMPKGKARARYEEGMIKKALECGMPVLGICGGMQRINVICGGTLHQNIPDLVGCDRLMQHRQFVTRRVRPLAFRSSRIQISTNS